MPDGAGRFTQDFSGPALLRIPLGQDWLRLQGYHLLRRRFPTPSTHPSCTTSWSYYPAAASTATVWAVPRSLATTWGITVVFSSSAYLDVSVQPVRPPLLGSKGLPHSEILGSTLLCSSPKLIASTVCSFYLSSQSKHHNPHNAPHPSYPVLRPDKTRKKPCKARMLTRPTIFLLLTSLCQRTFIAFLPTPRFPFRRTKARVELVGVEPTTSCLQGRRSSQLSYSPIGGGLGRSLTFDLTLIRRAL